MAETWGLCGAGAGSRLGSPITPCAALAVAEVQVSPAGPILENQTVTLVCNTPKEAPSDLHYSWYKNHVPLEDAHSHILRLHSVTRDDTGFYFCEVQNAHGSERSGPVSVVVNRKWPGWGGTGHRAGPDSGAPRKGWGPGHGNFKATYLEVALSSRPSSAHLGKVLTSLLFYKNFLFGSLNL